MKSFVNKVIGLEKCDLVTFSGAFYNTKFINLDFNSTKSFKNFAGQKFKIVKSTKVIISWANLIEWWNLKHLKEWAAIMPFGICQMGSLQMLGCSKSLAVPSQECCSAYTPRCQLRCHPYALYVWHAGRKPGILHRILRNLAHTPLLTEDHSTPIWKKSCQV